MKTFRLLFFLASITAISVAFFACDGGDEPVKPSLAPSITFVLPTSQSLTVDHYNDIEFNFTCTYNLNTKKALSRVKIVAKYTPGGTETLLDTLVPAAYSNSWSLQYVYTVSPLAPENQIISITVSVEDKDAQVFSKVYTLSVKDISDIFEKDFTMGAQSNTTEGSYFSADSFKVFKSATAKLGAYQSKIDFVYLYDEYNGNGDCIAAPKDTILWDQSLNLCGSFVIKNATKFKQLAFESDSAYNKIRSTAAIAQLFSNGSGSGVGVIKTLTDEQGTVPTIIVFKTVGGKYGIIRVKLITSVNPGMKNSILLNVRVSKK